MQQIFSVHSHFYSALHKSVVQFNSYAIDLCNKVTMWQKLQLYAYYPELDELIANIRYHTPVPTPDYPLRGLPSTCKADGRPRISLASRTVPNETH